MLAIVHLKKDHAPSLFHFPMNEEILYGRFPHYYHMSNLKTGIGYFKGDSPCRPVQQKGHQLYLPLLSELSYRHGQKPCMERGFFRLTKTHLEAFRKTESLRVFCSKIKNLCFLYKNVWIVWGSPNLHGG